MNWSCSTKVKWVSISQIFLKYHKLVHEHLWILQYLGLHFQLGGVWQFAQEWLLFLEQLYLTLLLSTKALLHFTGLYVPLPWLYFTLLDSTTFYHGSTSIYLTLHYSIKALLHPNWFYIALPWLYFILYLTLDYPTMAMVEESIVKYRMKESHGRRYPSRV